MPQSLVQIYAHVIFSTKQRKPFLRDRDVRERMHGYLVGACKQLGSPALIVGGVENHMHLLCRLGKTNDVASLVRDLKRESSKWIKREEARCPDFRWQQGYGAFSISPSHVDALTEHIVRQEEHHRRESFQDEFRRICLKNGLDVDEQYVWD